jgi:phosphate transport system protein
MTMGVRTTTKVELGSLETMIFELSDMAETSISRAITALMLRDTMLARAIIREDALIDRAEIEVQQACLEVLEKGRPAGADLRLVVAILKINDSLERIGDLSENVADVVVEMGDWERFRCVPGINELAEQAQDMVHRCLRAFSQRDTELARKVIADDDRVDELYDKIKRHIELELDRIPENASPLLKLEHVVRQFERMADVATNIAEEVIFVVEGQIVRHNSGSK